MRTEACFFSKLRAGSCVKLVLLLLLFYGATANAVPGNARCWRLAANGTATETSAFKIKVTYTPPGGAAQTIEISAIVQPGGTRTELLNDAKTKLQAKLDEPGGLKQDICLGKPEQPRGRFDVSFTIGAKKEGATLDLTVERLSGTDDLKMYALDPPPDECPCLPTVSPWSLLMLSSILLAGIAIKFGRRRAARN